MRKALVVGLVAGAVVLVARRRFRRQVGAAVRLPAAVAVALLAAPLDLLDDIWGGVTDVAGAVKDWVLGLVHHLEAIVEGWVNDLWDAVTSAGRWVVSLFDSVIDFARSLVEAVYGFVRAVFDQVVRWAEDAVGAVYGFVRAVFDQVVRWAEAAVGAVWDFVGGIFKWVIDNIFTPLWDALQWVWHNIVEPAIDFLTGLIGKAFDWLYGLLKWAFQQVAGLWEWVWRYAARLLAVVEKAFDWLVMLATHGPGWIVHQVEEWFSSVPDWLVHQLGNAMAKEGPSLEKFLADWLGG